MKQFEGFTNKLPVPDFTRDGSFHTVTLTGLNPDTKLVTIEVTSDWEAGPGQVAVGVKPTGTTLADSVYNWNLTTSGYSTTTFPIDGSNQIDCAAVTPVGTPIVFSVVGEWGGDAVVSLGVDPVEAPGFVLGETGGIWRDVTLTGIINPEDEGAVEAVIAFAKESTPTEGADAEVRAVGSTWPSFDGISGGHSHDATAKVNKENTVEVFEQADGKGNNKDSFIYFVGYVRKGAFDDGSGTRYRYRSILDPTDDEVGSGSWQTFNVAPTTSPTVESIYWRIVNNAASPATLYAREVGSENSEISQANRKYLSSFLLTVDENQEVEHYMEGADTESWIFAYIEEYVRRSPQVTVTEL